MPGGPVVRVAFGVEEEAAPEGAGGDDGEPAGGARGFEDEAVGVWRGVVATGERPVFDEVG